MKDKETVSGIVFGIFVCFLLVGNILNYILK